MIRLLLIVLLMLSADDDGRKLGKRANALYQEGEYERAAEMYREALAGLSDDGDPSVRYGLQNNLGATLLQLGQVEAAREAFGRAVDLAVNAPNLARSSYNAGNGAYLGTELQAALDHYRRSLLSDPDNDDARYNYEFVKRQLQEQQQQQQQQQNQQGDSDQDQNQDQNSEDQQEQQDDQQQQQQQQQDQDREGDQNQQQNPDPSEEGGDQEQEARPEPQESDPTKLSREQAQRILQALQNEEEQLLREVQRTEAPARRVEKDW